MRPVSSGHYRPDEKLFFKVYTVEQVAAYVKAHPTDWMANPYSATGYEAGR